MGNKRKKIFGLLMIILLILFVVTSVFIIILGDKMSLEILSVLVICSGVFAVSSLLFTSLYSIQLSEEIDKIKNFEDVKSHLGVMSPIAIVIFLEVLVMELKTVKTLRLISIIVFSLILAMCVVTLIINRKYINKYKERITREEMQNEQRDDI